MRFKHLFIFAMATIGIAVCAACDNDDANAPDSPPVNIDDNGEFVPPSGPIGPLSAGLRPVLTSGKKWVREYVASDNKKSIYTESIESDTVANGHNAKKIVSQNESGACSVIPEEYGKKMELCISHGRHLTLPGQSRNTAINSTIP